MAQAETQLCSDIQRQEAQIERQITDLVLKHPFLNTFLSGCVLAGQDIYETTGNDSDAADYFWACAVGICSFAEVDNCVSVGEQWFDLGIKSEQIKNQKREYRCRD